MRYFLIFDELSGPGGDLYRWDGAELVAKIGQDWGMPDAPNNQSIEDYLSYLAGGRGSWEEVDEPS